MKRHEQAQAQMDGCLELDPFNAVYQAGPAWNLLMSRRYDDAIAQFQKVLKADPNYLPGYGGLSDAFHIKGMFEEALSAYKGGLTQHQVDRELAQALTRGYADAGYTGAMRRAAERLAALSKDPYVQPTWVASFYVKAGQWEPALKWLERGYQVRDSQLVYINAMPIFDRLRATPRFQDLLLRMNLLRQ